MANNKSRRAANRVFQRQYKEKMYAAGFKQKVIWIKREDDPAPAPAADLKFFLPAFRRAVKLIPKEKRPKLFRDILSIVEAQSEGEKYGN